MAQITSLFRTITTIVLITFITSTFFTVSASPGAKDHQTTWTKTVKTEKIIYLYSTNNSTSAGIGISFPLISPAMIPAQFNLPDLIPQYVKPVNDPKYDNRVNGHAQEQLDRLLQQKIMRS